MPNFTKMGMLVIIEGLCGTGKTTLGGKLAAAIPGARFYDEGAAGHPVSLNGYAYFTSEAHGYPDALRSRIVEGDGYRLAPYAGMDLPPGLREMLAARELCWRKEPVASRAVYEHAHLRRWQSLAEALGEDTVVFEGVFFQHPIHDLMRLYSADDGTIRAHILATAEVIAHLPVRMIYLDHADVAAHQAWIAGVRGKPHYTEPARVKGVMARKALELSLLEALPFPAERIACAPSDWDGVYRRALSAVMGGTA